MSKLVSMQKLRANLFFQEMLFMEREHSVLKSKVKKATCYVCKRGLDDRFGLTAKRIPTGIVFLCEDHYS